MKTTADISLLDTLPDSISGDKKVEAAAKAIDPQLRKIGENTDNVLIYANIDKLDSLVLDHLAEQFNVTPWRDYWNVGLKRAAIKINIANKRKKGTLAAIKKAVESLGSAVYIIPWYDQEPKGKPGTFRVVATYFDGAISSEDAQEDVIKAIDDAKPFSRHYELVMQNAVKGGINIYGCIRPVTVAKLYNS